MSTATDVTAIMGARNFSSPLGDVHIFTRNGMLTGVYFSDQRDCPVWIAQRSCSTCDRVADWLLDYFDGNSRQIDFEFDLNCGTELQQQVWNALLKIQSGTTCSYAQIAMSIGRPSAVRAVANAIGKNPISIIIPCHRVVGSNGKLTGYAGGLHRKEWLLKHELS